MVFPANGTTVVDARVQSVQSFLGGLYILRVHAPTIAQCALPGQVVATPALAKALAIVRLSAASGQLELLYRADADSERAYLENTTGQAINLAGPLGQPFQLNTNRPRPLLIGEDVGIAAITFLANDISHKRLPYQPLVMLGASIAFPFTPAPSRMLVNNMPAEVIAALPLLDDLRIANRLASEQGLPGCFDGDVIHLARHWLTALAPTQHREIELFACGSHAMTQTAIALANEFNLPCQVSLEETFY